MADGGMIEIIEYDTKRINKRVQEVISRGNLYFPDIDIEVRAIVDAVRDMGDEVLVKLTEEFDGVSISPSSFRIPPSTIEAAYEKVDAEFLLALQESIQNITRYHENELMRPFRLEEGDGVSLEERVSPIEKVGLYVPGGKAIYPSSIVMNAVPAKVAGVSRIVVMTPPKNSADNPHVLVTFGELGLKEVYTLGGAQAIAALAFGTETVPKVDKIIGPGNIYVALAKRYVYGVVDIDMIAGPSEVVVLADDSADPMFIAADLLAQSEHDQMATAICITTSLRLGKEVEAEIARQIKMLRRQRIVAESLKNHGAIIVVKTLEEGIELVNLIAPEHLELMTQNPRRCLRKVKNAGAIFLGAYSPVPVGDYLAGPSHVLPTGGTARYSSPLSVYDFVKRSSIIEYSKGKIQKKGTLIRRLASVEGLEGHARAIEVREKGGSSPDLPVDANGGLNEKSA